MKKSSRKRLLISSIAMLLVAMVALGTATFAWFTSSTTATANGINVKTIKASKLEISKLNKVWGTTVAYGVDQAVYLPVSTNNGTTWFTANATAKDNYLADQEKAAENVSAKQPNIYYFSEQLNVRNSGEAAVNNAKITFSLSDATKPDYIRIALVPVTDTEENTDQLPNPASAETFMQNIFANDATSYKALTGTDVQSNLSEDITPKTTYEVTLGEGGTLNPGQTQYYNLYVWFEGQDAECIDNNAGASIGNITFTVQGETASQTP